MNVKLAKKQRKALRENVKRGLANQTIEALKEKRKAVKKQNAFKLLFKINLLANVVLISINIVLLVVILTF